MDLKRSRTAKIAIIMLLCTIAAFVITLINVYSRSSFGETNTAEQGRSEDRPQPALSLSNTEERLQAVAARMNSTAPRMIDPYTVLERASASGRTLTYHYRVAFNASERERLRRFALQNIVPQICSGALRPAMRKGAVSYKYSYTGRQFNEPVEVNINENTCANLELSRKQG